MNTLSARIRLQKDLSRPVPPRLLAPLYHLGGMFAHSVQFVEDHVTSNRNGREAKADVWWPSAGRGSGAPRCSTGGDGFALSASNDKLVGEWLARSEESPADSSFLIQS